MTPFENVKKNFGFGCMRLPMQNDEIDKEEMDRMVDTFLDNGFNYFDTAHGYLGQKSETAVRESLVKRHPRDAYILTNKLSTHFFNKTEEVRPLFELQLERCGVDYFDFYLMHAQSEEIYVKYQRLHAYEETMKLKEEGKFKHLVISFHDRAEVLDKILSEHPEIEAVQIQLNYLDFEDEVVQSRKVLETAVKHGKPVIVMEPVKGGSLVNLPEDAQACLDKLQGGSNASYALRFAAGCKGVAMVLSGMGNMDMMNDNIKTMKDFTPLNEEEREAVENVVQAFNEKHMIGCTACRYCTDGCPKHISIPDLFSCLNTKRIFHNWNTDYYYNNVYANKNNKASDCIKCGQCERICPQHLPIRSLLEEVAAEFDR